MIPNNHRGIALHEWLTAHPDRDIWARQAPDGTRGSDYAPGTVYFEVRDGGSEPTEAQLQPHYDAWLAATLPERGFVHGDIRVSYLEADCIRVREAQNLLANCLLYTSPSPRDS